MVRKIMQLQLLFIALNLHGLNLQKITPYIFQKLKYAMEGGLERLTRLIQSGYLLKG